MNPLWSVLAVCSVYAVSVASPGPSTILVVRRSASERDRKIGVASGLGTTLGSALYAAGSLFGFTLLLLHVEGLASLIRIAGGCYLIWLGSQALSSAGGSNRLAGAQTGESPKPLKAFRDALAINLANPKTAAFFISLLAPAISPDMPNWARVAMLVGIILIDLVYFQALALTFSRPLVRRAYARWQRAIDRVAGCVLTAFGVGLLVEGALER